MNRFKKGDIVRFVNEEGGRIMDYYAEREIDPDLIQHGNVFWHEDYYDKHASIYDVWGEFCIVKYKDREGNEVRLGFRPESLELAVPYKKKLINIFKEYEAIKDAKIIK